jgi:hypothetical protein
MNRRISYDPKERVIFVDLTGLVATPQLVDEIVDEEIALAKTLTEKVFMVVCWKDVKMDPASSDRYGERLPELLKHFRGIVRYDASEITTRLAIRAKNMKQHTQNDKTHIYSSREEALAAVRHMEREQVQK